MKCPKCGKEIANDSLFCEFCGVKIEQPAVQAVQPVETPVVGEKQRHGFVTFWLWFMVVVNAVMCVTNFAIGFGTVAYIAACLMAINVVNAVLLLNWKRLGFWLFIGVAVCSCALNVAMESIPGAFGAVFSVAILFGILQIHNKGGVSCWSLLE